MNGAGVHCRLRIPGGQEPTAGTVPWTEKENGSRQAAKAPRSSKLGNDGIRGNIIDAYLRATASALEALAKAHDLDLNTYMEKLADAME